MQVATKSILFIQHLKFFEITPLYEYVYCTPLLELKNLAPSETIHRMVINHSCRLHMRIADR